MTAETLRFQDTRAANLLQDMRRGSPVLWKSSVAMLVLALVCVILMQFDDRLLQGVSVWDKPAKFFFSLAVQFLTVSWAMSFLPHVSRGVHRVAVVMAACGWAELLYITARGAMGLTSHFNRETPFSSIAYSLMGAGAVGLTVTAFIIGAILWRHRNGRLMAEAAAVGLMLGAVLGTVAGGYMGAQTGHWVGGATTDANGIGFFHWSTTGGDLRVAHFVGLHAAQFVPLAALSGRRSLVYGIALLTTVATLFVFGQAIMGQPLLRL